MVLLSSMFCAFLALLLDRLLGEPSRFHPLVGFGHWAHGIQRLLNPARQADSYQFNLLHRVLGVVAVLLALSPILIVMAGLLVLMVFFPWLAALLHILVLYLCLGGRSLAQHSEAVSMALQQRDLPLARDKLGMIVSRETGALNEQEVAQATVESVLENSSDAVFASLFWFAIGGGGLALLHRWVNTLDAMWGYKTPAMQNFGWAAARLDDVMNYLPARLTGCCFVLLNRPVFPLADNRAWHCWRTQAKYCASPNGGVVMTSGAGALDVQLSEGGWYQGQWQSKPDMGCGAPADTESIGKALSLVWKACGIFMSVWLLFGLLNGYWLWF